MLWSLSNNSSHFAPPSILILINVLTCFRSDIAIFFGISYEKCSRYQCGMVESIKSYDPVKPALLRPAILNNNHARSMLTNTKFYLQPRFQFLSQFYKDLHRNIAMFVRVLHVDRARRMSGENHVRCEV